MGKLTTHVLDLHAGTPAAGVRIELHAMDAAVPELLGSTETNGDGRCSSPLLEGDTM
ncbi:hydroxyisourate hydrolase, partial [Nevskia ramosa]|uniref:hydroxyisourate hydrolase n=1 Tax=Nevskia ramosa TaxID=64002 RepID=UPI00344BF678